MSATAERDKLVGQHLDLVQGIAAKVRAQFGKHLEHEDLVAFGNTGLVEAASRFEAGRGAAFSTFAYYRIRGAMVDGLRTMGPFSRADIRHQRAAERTHAYLQDHADNSSAAMADDSGASQKPGEVLASIAETLSGIATISLVSLDLPDAVEPADPSAIQADAALSESQQAERIRRAVKSLPDKERQLMEAHYFGDKNLMEAGAAMGLSKSWACRLHARAVNLLRKRLQDD
ncbi:MAG: sigma-70 family RNA polymerase sigma factor [Deltaproteobacteria bacterium]|nr:sigma-70 family RNA polymerase sigma factor [Deltaproteobacteria bacterium]